MIDEKELDLNKPYSAFEQPVAPEGETVKEEVKEDIVEASEEEESKVPYSRFKKFHDRAKELEVEAEQARRDAIEWRTKAETYKPKESDVDLPSEWKELYGDSEASVRAYKLDLKRQESFMERAEQRAIEALERKQEQEIEATEKNLSEIDSNFENLSAFVGRDLTEKEQSAVLDIVDEYTPKGDDGKYLGALIPFDKAWEIYEMKNQVSKFPKQKSRDNVASLSSSQSQGNPESEVDEAPPRWGDWRKGI